YRFLCASSSRDAPFHDSLVGFVRRHRGGHLLTI
ncbi:MAG: hypothetical protein EZS28_048976, partial [Streblomastix strix]